MSSREITNNYGMYYDYPTGAATVTNNYGIYYNYPTGAATITNNYGLYTMPSVTLGDNGTLYSEDGKIESFNVICRGGKYTLQRPESKDTGKNLILSKYSLQGRRINQVDNYVFVFVFSDCPSEIVFCDMNKSTPCVKMSALLWKYEQEGRFCTAFGVISNILDDLRDSERFYSVYSYRESLLFDENLISLFI